MVIDNELSRAISSTFLRTSLVFFLQWSPLPHTLKWSFWTLPLTEIFYTADFLTQWRQVILQCNRNSVSIGPRVSMVPVPIGSESCSVTTSYFMNRIKYIHFKGVAISTETTHKQYCLIQVIIGRLEQSAAG